MEQGGAHAHHWPYYFSLEFHSHKKIVGERPIYLSEVICEGIKNIPLQKRHTQRKLAMSMGVSKTMVHHWIVDLTIHIHLNSLKPVLTEENKVAWLFMVLDS